MKKKNSKLGLLMFSGLAMLLYHVTKNRNLEIANKFKADARKIRKDIR